MMRKEEAKRIAIRAAKLATEDTTDDCIDLTYDDYYKEYLDQLQSNDYQCLRMWIGCQIEEGIHEAIEIMKMLIHARLEIL